MEAIYVIKAICVTFGICEVLIHEKGCVYCVFSPDGCFFVLSITLWVQETDDKWQVPFSFERKKWTGRRLSKQMSKLVNYGFETKARSRLTKPTEKWIRLRECKQ